MTLDDLDGNLFADVPQVAEITGMDPRTIRRAAQAGEIPASRVGAKWMIPTAWLREQAGTPAPTPPGVDLDDLADRVADRLFTRFAQLLGSTPASQPGNPG